MEFVRIEISKDLLDRLYQANHLKIEDFTVISVRDTETDYSKYGEWLEAKQKADKSYKELKKIEEKIKQINI